MKLKYILYAPAVLIIGAIGFAVMTALVYFAPMSSGDNVLYFLVTLLIVTLGLFVPFWMLQVGFKGIHIYDDHEEPLHLKDLPKDDEHLRAKG